MCHVFESEYIYCAALSCHTVKDECRLISGPGATGARNHGVSLGFRARDPLVELLICLTHAPFITDTRSHEPGTRPQPATRTVSGSQLSHTVSSKHGSLISMSLYEERKKERKKEKKERKKERIHG